MRSAHFRTWFTPAVPSKPQDGQPPPSSPDPATPEQFLNTRKTKHNPFRCLPLLTPSNNPTSSVIAARQLQPNQCPASQSTCGNCGRQGHWVRTPRCPAVKIKCRLCHRMGHYEKCCRASKKQGQQSRTGNSIQPAQQERQQQKNRTNRLQTPKPENKPKNVCVLASFKGKSANLYMLPDTGADITIIGPQHLQSLGLSTSDLQPCSPQAFFTADGSPMAPPLGFFQARLTFGNNTCTAQLYVHSDIDAPLLSWPLSETNPGS